MVANTKTGYIAVIIMLLWASGSLVYGQSSERMGRQDRHCLTLTDSEGQALAFAHLHLPDRNLDIITDARGHACLVGLPEGSYAAEVHFPGFARTQITLTLTAETEQQVAVALKYYTFEAVVLTGRSQATEAARNPQASASIGGEALRRLVGSNLIEALGVLPGVSGIGSGPAVMKPVIRGLSFNRVVTVGPTGLRQEGQQWGEEHGIEIDGYAIERAEVLKGPASLAFGSDALGGVLNLQAAPLPIDGTGSGLITADYQSNGGLMGFSARYARAFRGWVVGAQVSGRQARPYENAADGRVWNTGFQELSARLQLGMQRRWGSSVLSLSAFDQTWGMAEGERDSVGHFVGLFRGTTGDESRTATDAELSRYEIFYPQQQIRHLTTAWLTTAQLGGTKVITALGYQLNQRGELGSPSAGDRVPTLGWNLHTVTYDLKLVLPEFGGGWKPTVGAGGMWQKSLNTGAEEYLTPNYRLFDLGAFGLIERRWEQFTLSAGIRYDHRALTAEALWLDTLGKPVATSGDPAFGEERFAPLSRNFSALTGSVGASFAFTPHLIAKLNLSRGYRAPNIAELRSNGAHEGTLRYEYGSGSLAPEHSLQLDLGIEVRSDWVTVQASVFYNYIENYIFVEKLSAAAGGDSIPDPSEPQQVAYRFSQAGAANLFGGEIGLALTPPDLPGLTFENNLSLVRGHTLGTLGRADSTRYLPFMPAPRWRTELRYEHRSANKMLKTWWLALSYDYSFAQTEVLSAAGTERRNPAYGLLGASTGVTIARPDGRPWATLMLTAQNLTDEIYQNHLSRLRYAAQNPASGRQGIFNPGRNLSLRLVVPL